MPLERWPYTLATPDLADYGLGRDVGQLSRTPFPTGPANQRRAQVEFKRREFSVLVRESNLARFRGWLDQHGRGWLLYEDLDDHIERQVRIVGGSVALQRQRDLLIADGKPPEKYWKGRVVLEGFA